MNADKLINDYANLEAEQQAEFDRRYKALLKQRRLFSALLKPKVRAKRAK